MKSAHRIACYIFDFRTSLKMGGTPTKYIYLPQNGTHSFMICFQCILPHCSDILAGYIIAEPRSAGHGHVGKVPILCFFATLLTHISDAQLKFDVE